MDFSFWPTTAQPWPDLLRGCRWAEANGWHGVWVPDHFMTDAPISPFCDSDRQREQVLGRLGNHGGMVGASVDEIRTAAGAYADAGVDELVIADFNLPRDRREDVLGRLQQEVLEELR